MNRNLIANVVVGENNKIQGFVENLRNKRAMAFLVIRDHTGRIQVTIEKEKHPELALLSSREMEVFEQLLSDKTLAEIAEGLFISHSTVHFHCKNIYKKLGISSRRQFIITYKDLC